MQVALVDGGAIVGMLAEPPEEIATHPRDMWPDIAWPDGLRRLPVIDQPAPTGFDEALKRAVHDTTVLSEDGRSVIYGWTLVDRYADDLKGLDALRTLRKAVATAKRWEVETGGITISGIPVATDDRSKTLILGKRAKARENPDQTFRWKAVNGWVELTGAQIIAIADAVADHVQACFDREGELHDAIDAAKDAAAVLAIDITADWPS